MRTGRPARLGRGGEDWRSKIERECNGIEINTRRCVRKKEKKDRTAGGQVLLYTQILLSCYNTKIPTKHFPFLHAS
jgi:hypothetical protein